MNGNSNTPEFPIRFGKYVLLRRLATGGMAELFLALLRSVAGFEKLLVIKRILPSMNTDQDFIAMLLHEARLAATLTHPNVVQVFDVGHVDDSYYIAMEHIHGEDLRSIFKQMKRLQVRNFPMEHAIAIMIGTCAGLAHAHEKKAIDGTPLHIVHRDISPQNVILSFSGDVKVVDFGIAQSGKLLRDGTKSGCLKGKIPYMSPEQARGEELDWRSDIFAAGVVLFELTTGKRPFKGKNELETLNLVCDGAHPLLSSISPGYPKRLETIVTRALEKDRKDRYQSAREMQAELESYVRDERIAVSAIDMSGWMHSLFADRLARQKEELQDLMQLAEAISSRRRSFAGEDNVEKTQVQPEPPPTIKSLAPSITSLANTTEPTGPTTPKRNPILVGAVMALAAAATITIAVRMLRANKPQEAPGESSISPPAAPDRQEHFGTLRIETDPAQAVIWINGSRRSETTPSTIDRLPLGLPTEISLSKEGYVTIQKTIELKQERPDETFTTHLLKATLSLNVSTNAPAPMFYVDGKLVVGPKIEGISANERHRITVIAAGFLGRSLNFLGSPNDQKSITIELEKDDNAHKPQTPQNLPTSTKPGTGKLNVGSRGGFCSVSVDGRPHGMTPVGGIPLSSGTHRVVCRAENGKTQSRTLTIETEQTLRETFVISE